LPRCRSILHRTRIGKHKLAPNISPGKTVEGGFGGLALGIVGGIISKKLFFAELQMVAYGSAVDYSGRLSAFLVTCANRC